jgi:hypothetical protein
LHSSNAIQINPALLEQFSRKMRENFTSGSIPFRKAYLQSLIDVIEVDDTQIRIKGSKDVLERAVLASQNGVVPSSQMSTKWRSLGESNPCFSLERAKSIRLMIIVKRVRRWRPTDVNPGSFAQAGVTAPVSHQKRPNRSAMNAI